MEFQLSEQKLTKQEVDAFNSQFGGRLPDSFLKFYLEFNGGIPSHGYYGEMEIASFASIKYGEPYNTITERILNLSDAERLPIGYIPFAHDPGGWTYCIDTSETGYGAIYVLRNGLEDNSPVRIANSFELFIAGLSNE